jgi:hypothetical protein
MVALHMPTGPSTQPMIGTNNHNEFKKNAHVAGRKSSVGSYGRKKDSRQQWQWKLFAFFFSD